jgi:tryptophan synthase alpha chain
VAGLIVPDLPLEESAPLEQAARTAGLELVGMAAPTSGPPRLRRVARQSQGFVYLVALTGITGERADLPADLVGLIRDLRAVTTKPICVGFGISTPAHVAEVVRYADGAIVGSAIVRLVESLAGDPLLVRKVGDFVASLKAATRGAAAAPRQ